MVQQRRGIETTRNRLNTTIPALVAGWRITAPDGADPDC